MCIYHVLIIYIYYVREEEREKEESSILLKIQIREIKKEREGREEKKEGYGEEGFAPT